MGVWVKNILILIILCLSSNTLFAGEVQHIDNQVLKELMQQDVPLIDVRATSEWKQTGIVEGSHLLMFYDEKGKYNLDQWLLDVSEIAEKNQPIILICHSGGRSKQLAKYLTKVVGYEKVYNVKQGINRWMKENNQTVAVE